MDPTKEQNPATDTPEGENSTVTAKEFDFNTCTLEEFDTEIINGTNYRARDEWLAAGPDSDDPRFSRVNQMLSDRESGKEVSTPESGNQHEGSVQKDGADGDGAAPEGDKEKTTEGDGGTEGGNGETEVETVEINGLKISKDLLAETFLNGRTPEEAVLEALKAERSGQQFIDDLKPRHAQLQETTIGLRKQLIEAQKALDLAKSEVVASSQQQQQPQIEVPEIDFDSVDVYDPDAVEKFIGDARKKLDELKAKVKKPTEPSDQQTKTEPEKKEPVKPSKEIQDQVDAIRQSSVDAELVEIAELQRSVPELRGSLPFQQIDQGVANFQQTLAGMTGKDHISAMNTYYSETPEGEQLRTTCEARGVKPPAEVDLWAKIMEVRKIRNGNIVKRAKAIEGSILAKTGKRVTVEPYEVEAIEENTYLDLYRKANPPDINKLQMKARIDGHKQAGRSVSESQQTYVPEPTPDMGSQEDRLVLETEEGQCNLSKKLYETPKLITSDEAKTIIGWAKEMNSEFLITKDLIAKAKG